MNRKKRKTALILLPAILCAIVLLGIRGTRKTIDKTVPARVYEDNGTTYAPSSITISGTLKKTWSSTSFVGTFSVDVDTIAPQITPIGQGGWRRPMDKSQ